MREMQCLGSTKEHITFSEKSRIGLCRSVQHDGSMIAQTGKVMHYTWSKCTTLLGRILDRVDPTA